MVAPPFERLFNRLRLWMRQRNRADGCDAAPGSWPRCGWFD